MMEGEAFDNAHTVADKNVLNWFKFIVGNPSRYRSVDGKIKTTIESRFVDSMV